MNEAEKITRLIANHRWQEAESAITEYLDGPCPLTDLAAYQALQDYVVRPKAEEQKVAPVDYLWLFRSVNWRRMFHRRKVVTE